MVDSGMLQSVAHFFTDVLAGQNEAPQNDLSAKRLELYNLAKENSSRWARSFILRSKCLMANGNPEPENKGLILKKPARKPYVKPAFRFERVFETQALSCGKVSTQNQCHINRKTS
jgi:hypothetical protein